MKVPHFPRRRPFTSNGITTPSRVNTGGNDRVQTVLKIDRPRISRDELHQFQPRHVGRCLITNPSPTIWTLFHQTAMATDNKIYACIDYEDTYVQPLLLAALKARLPSELLVLIKDASELPSTSSGFLQWRQYESIDFDHLMAHPTASLANSYVIRKALIRKHYLSTTVAHWLSKHPDSVLRDHVKPAVEFEVDYAEFLDDALVEAWELKESWVRNERLDAEGGDGNKEWWILKPGMSDRGQGIRLFSSEQELRAIFQGWDPDDSDGDEDEDDEDGTSVRHEDAIANSTSVSLELEREHGKNGITNGVITSQLRHFVAQPYIHPPLLLPSLHPTASRKFHVRTYVLAVGALKVYVYKPMLALFAALPYTLPSSNGDLSRHLTNTCLQTGEREGSVRAFWDLPSLLPSSGKVNKKNWKQEVFTQICSTTAEVFEAAARSMSVHFQLFPNAFELFGVDFLVDRERRAWLLEVNAFPDFRQTGAELEGVVRGLFEGAVERAVGPFFGVEGRDGGGEEMVEVLDVDLGRR